MKVAPGSTDVATYFVLRTAADGTATTGATITNIDLQYIRSGSTPSAKVDATALGSVDAAHSDNKAYEVDATDAPGLYRVDWPDAAFAAGVGEVILSVKLASSFTEHLRVELDNADEPTLLLAKTGFTTAGTETVGTALKKIAAMAAGDMTDTAGDIAVTESDGATTAFTNTPTATGRTIT